MAIKKQRPAVKTMIRINSRVREDQFKFIKNYAKKWKSTDGEALRAILDNYIMSV